MTKKILYLLGLAAAVCCTKPEETSKTTLDIYDGSGKACETINLEAKPSYTEIKLYTSDSWTIKSDASWLSFSPESGEKGSRIIITVGAEGNTGEDRSASFTISCQNLSKTITAVQAGGYVPGTEPIPEDPKDEGAKYYYSTNIIAHRGYHENYGENTLEAFRAAMELDIYGSEFDVWKNASGELVINHDTSVGALPSLRSFMEEGKKHPDKKLVLEFKKHSTDALNNEVVDDVLKMVKEFDMESQMIYISGYYPHLLRVKADSKDHIVMSVSPASKSVAQYIADGIDILDWSYGTFDISAEYFNSALESPDIQVGVWTLNTADLINKWVGKGAQYITTDYPKLAQDLCRLGKKE